MDETKLDPSLQDTTHNDAQASTLPAQEEEQGVQAYNQGGDVLCLCGGEDDGM